MPGENDPQNFPGGPHFTQRLFSQEVGIAEAIAGDALPDLKAAQPDAYVFSNGRKFKDRSNPYQP
jgi:hypothetical protein